MVVGVLLLRAHQPGIRCQTVFVTQLRVLAFSGVSRKLTFLQNIENVLSALETFLWECAI